MKRHVFFYLAAVLFFLTAIINFTSGNPNASGVMWLGMGATYLCVGAAMLEKSRKDQNDTSEGKKDKQSGGSI